MSKMIIEHICEHPQREMLNKIGGVPLSTTRLVYQQYVSLDDPRDSSKRASPTVEGLPRTWQDRVINGGVPWSELYAPTLMRGSVVQTRARMKHEPRVFDWENAEVLRALREGNNPNAVRRSLDVYRWLITFGGAWAYPRHDWLPTIRRYPLAFPIPQTMFLDSYWWRQSSLSQLKSMLRDLAECVVALSRDPSEAWFAVQPMAEGGARATLPPALLAQHLEAIYEVGGRKALIWHDGHEWTKPGSPQDVNFARSVGLCGMPEYRRVFEEFGGVS